MRLILRELHQSTFLTGTAGLSGKEREGMEGSFQLFLEATILFVQDLLPFLLGEEEEEGGRFSIVTMTKQARKVKETRWKRSPEKEREVFFFCIYFPPEEKKSSSGKVESVAHVSRPP